MNNTLKPDFDRTLKRLRQSIDAMPWPARRGVVRRVASALADGSASETILQLVYLLAGDKKWEVRTDVAELLLFLPGEHFTRVAALLSEDTNSFVRRAAERALDRRRRGQQTTRRVRLEHDRVQSQYAAMAKLHGKPVAEKARRIAERLFDHMVGATVHEMRGILTPLMASTSSLLHHLDDGAIDPDGFRRQLTKTADRLAFLEKLLEDMRTYTQQPPLERRRERLGEIVEAALVVVRENLQAQGRWPEQVVIKKNIPETLVAEVSRHLILIAIANLLKNAFEVFWDGPGMSRPGTITITARSKEDESMEIVVQDNGVGLCEEDLQEIMDFVPGKTSKKNWGTGFGLPIAQRNLAAHGGTIGIKSQVDQGTTVTITLPIEQEMGGDYEL